MAWRLGKQRDMLSQETDKQFLVGSFSRRVYLFTFSILLNIYPLKNFGYTFTFFKNFARVLSTFTTTEAEERINLIN